MTDTPYAPTHAEPVTAVIPEAPQPQPQPQAPAPAAARTVVDVVMACDDFKALEWLEVVKALDAPSHDVQGDVTLVALAVAVVEDARANGFWQWEKFGAMSASELLTHLGVDLQVAQEAVKKPHPFASPKSDG